MTDNPKTALEIKVLQEMLKAAGALTPEVQLQISKVVHLAYSAGTKDGADAMKTVATENGDIDVDDVECPDCGSEMLVRQGKFGMFLGCSNFPDCHGSRNI